MKRRKINPGENTFINVEDIKQGEGVVAFNKLIQPKVKEFIGYVKFTAIESSNDEFVNNIIKNDFGEDPIISRQPFIGYFAIKFPEGVMPIDNRYHVTFSIYEFQISSGNTHGLISTPPAVDEEGYFYFNTLNSLGASYKPFAIGLNVKITYYL